jgi:hypothetical protein
MRRRKRARMRRRKRARTRTRTRRTRRRKKKRRSCSNSRRRREEGGRLNTALAVISYDQGCFLVNLRPVRYIGIEVKRVRQGVIRLRIICSNGLQ